MPGGGAGNAIMYVGAAAAAFGSDMTVRVSRRRGIGVVRAVGRVGRYSRLLNGVDLSLW